MFRFSLLKGTRLITAEIIDEQLSVQTRLTVADLKELQYQIESTLFAFSLAHGSTDSE